MCVDRETGKESPAYTREQMEALLRDESFQYQKVELPFGLATAGIDRSGTAGAIFPADLTGKSVLDVGSNMGLFCFEALRRGAARAVGIDISPDSVRKSRRLAEALGLDAEFQVGDVEARPFAERFDYVLCLNVLHHVRNPLATLEYLAQITRERLVLETRTLASPHRRYFELSAWTRLLLERLPVVFIGKVQEPRRYRFGLFPRRRKPGIRFTDRLFISAPALRNFLLHQRPTFARIEAIPTDSGRRVVTIAHKRRIGHLLVVSGPTSSGKKTLMRKLAAGELPELNARLGVADPRLWGERVPMYDLFEGDEPRRERLLMHHDFMYPLLRWKGSVDRDETLEIVETADRVTFLTVWTPPERLVRQITASAIERRERAGRRPHRHHLQCREIYRDPARTIGCYRAWFASVRRRSADQIVVSGEGSGFAILTLDEWESLAGELERAR
jgi:SAM-dependent methyltransferase